MCIELTEDGLTHLHAFKTPLVTKGELMHYAKFSKATYQRGRRWGERVGGRIDTSEGLRGSHP